MEFPLWVLLVPFGLVAMITSMYVFFNLYHLYAFGVAKHGTSFLMAAYAASYVAVVLVSVSLLVSIDWASSISIDDIFSGSGPSSNNRIFDL